MKKSFVHKVRAYLILVAVFGLLPITSVQAGDEEKEARGMVFMDFFTDGNDAGWTQINRSWRVAEGRYILDGSYLPGAQGRDGYAVTHEGDRTWRNYVVNMTFDHTNPSGLPTPDVHNAIFFVRVKQQPPFGTFYRIDVWPFGTTDPRTGSGTIPGGLVGLQKYVNGVGLASASKVSEYSNSVAGTNTITIMAIGSTIRVIINGEQVLAWHDDDDPIRYGGIGVGAIWEASAWFDNVIVHPVGRHSGPN